MAVYNLDKYTSADGLGFPLNFRRGNPNPLDNSSVWASLEAAQNYAATDPTAYVGQVLSVVDGKGTGASATATVYVIVNTIGTLERVGTITLGDDVTIVKSADNKLSIKGYSAAATGAILKKTAEGLVWEVPSTATVDNLTERVTAAEGEIDALQADNTANKAAITKLNGDDKTEGSVAYQIAQIVAGAPEAYDTLVEIATWITEHGDDAAAMQVSITNNTNAITALQGLVGDTAVAIQIASAIDAALKDGSTNKYALAADLTALGTRVTTLEGLVGTKAVGTQIDEKITAALKVDGEDKYALKQHTHAITDITGLSDGLDAKAEKTTVNAISSKLGTLPEGYTDLVDYIDSKSDTTALAGRVTAAEGEIDTLQEQMTTAQGNITTNANDINALETLVGTTAVSTQISTAITNALKWNEMT